MRELHGSPLSSRMRFRALVLLLLAVAPISAESQETRGAPGAPLRKISVRVKDEHGRPVKDLRQDEFVLEEDEHEQVIEWWNKSNEFGRVRYQLGYRPRRERDGQTHQIHVRVKRPGTFAKFSPKNTK